MAMYRHIVLFMYIAELCTFVALSVGYAWSGGRFRRKTSNVTDIAFSMSALMVIRMIVKMIYFYGEFFISPWQLNVLINFAMDTTYVCSIYGMLRLMAAYQGVHKRLPRRMFYIAAFLYVVGFLLIALLWADRASNHNIQLEPGLPIFLYSANELFFLVVAVVSIISMYRLPSGLHQDGRHMRTAFVVGVFTACYVLYVYLWDMSFFIEAIDSLRSCKPFDGVLLFAAFAVAAILRLAPLSGSPGAAGAVVERIGHASYGETATASSHGQTYEPLAEDRIRAFSEHISLTPRETEILRLVIHGHSNVEIAEECGISENTAKRHVYNIFRKAGVKTRYELFYSCSKFSDDSADEHIIR